MNLKISPVIPALTLGRRERVTIRWREGWRGRWKEEGGAKTSRSSGTCDRVLREDITNLPQNFATQIPVLECFLLKGNF